MTVENAIKNFDAKKYKKALKDMDKAIALNEEANLKMHQMKLSLWMEIQTQTHNQEWWTEKEMTKKEAKVLFDEFLELHNNAFGKQFDRYNRMTREHHFENWKAHMKWYFKKNKKQKNDSA